MSQTPATSPEFRVIAYPLPWRVIAGVFFTVSRMSLVIIGLMIITGMYFSPPLLLRLMVFLALTPWLAALMVSLAFNARVRRIEDRWCLVRGGLFRRGECVELDQDAVRSIVPWALPAPGLGMTLRLAMPRAECRIELQTDAPGRLAELVFPVSGLPVADPMRTPAAAYANARFTYGSRGRPGFAARFVLFPLVPTFILFRLHQYIGYGGMLGQYHLHGLQPYLSTLAFHWILVLMHLVLWASVLRAFAELAAAGAARFAPRKASVVRQWAERAVNFFYYGGVIGLIAVRASL
jgi:hypothetical protein